MMSRPAARTDPLFPRPLLARVALVWLAAAAVHLAISAEAIAHQHFYDPDDTLRLVQVRDLLAGQSWFDMHQYRIDPVDGGVLMHWSRLVDVPLAGVILALRPLLGQAGAELAAAIIVPLATMFAVLLLVGRLAWRMAGRELVMPACGIVAIAVPVMVQVLPMRIDHHGWQVVAALAALNGLMARNGRAGGWAAGVALAIGIAISVEGLPLALACAGVGAWRWWRGAESDWLTRFLAGLALASGGIFFATRGMADLAEHCDAVSPVHLAVFGWAGLAAAALGLIRPRRAGLVLAGFAAIAGGAMAIVFALAPQCSHGGFVALDPVVRQYWLDNVREGMPIWRQGLATALGIALPGFAGLAAALWLAMRGHEDRQWWRDYAFAMAATLALACGLARAGATSTAFAAVPLAWAARRLITVAWRTNAVRRIGVVLAVVAVILPSFPATLITMAQSRHSAGPGQPARVSAAGDDNASVADCRIPAAAPVLNGLGRANILAPLDIGPALLLAAPRVTVLATGHHRAGLAIHSEIDAFAGVDATAHAIIRARRIDVVALCPGLAESAIWAHIGPRGLAGRLLAGQSPAWLAPLPAIPGSRLRIWRVLR